MRDIQMAAAKKLHTNPIQNMTSTVTYEHFSRGSRLPFGGWKPDFLFSVPPLPPFSSSASYAPGFSDFYLYGVFRNCSFPFSFIYFYFFFGVSLSFFLFWPACYSSSLKSTDFYVRLFLIEFKTSSGLSIASVGWVPSSVWLGANIRSEGASSLFFPFFVLPFLGFFRFDCWLSASMSLSIFSFLSLGYAKVKVGLLSYYWAEIIWSSSSNPFWSFSCFSLIIFALLSRPPSS